MTILEKICQQYVEKWAKAYGYDDAPLVEFSYSADLHAAGVYIGSGSVRSIVINRFKWMPLPWSKRLFILGHEFGHWLQDKRGLEFDQDDASRIGMELANKEVMPIG